MILPIMGLAGIVRGMFDWLGIKLIRGRHRRLGAWGEALARRHLKRAGMKILGRNYRTPYGEVDILALDGDCVVFCEVKTRGGDAVDPASAIDATRRGRYRNAARHYLGSVGRQDLDARFDVVFVTFDAAGKARVEHIADAFQ